MSNRIVVLGAGESGTGAALLAKAKGLDVFVSDAGPIAEKYKQVLRNEGIAFEENGHTEQAILNNVAEVVKSPGIPDKVQLIRDLRKRGVPVISELEFAYRYTKAKFIAITGSNGKTTTTLLTYHLLKSAGMNVGLAGNIGDSLAKQVIRDDKDWYVLEVSSFQLDGMYNFKADIAILLNITPDHLDRYEYNFQNYVDSKFRLVQNMTAADYFISYPENEAIYKELSVRSIDAQQVYISLEGALEEGAVKDGEELVFQLAGKKARIAIDTLPIQGCHNYINTMAAVSAALIADVKEDAIAEALKTFKNAPHRLEKVVEFNGITFVNDSKATNVDSVKYALGSFKQPLVLIAGGVDKGNDYSLIYDLVMEKVKTIVCMGKDNGPLHKAFGNSGIKLIDADSIQRAVEEAFKEASPGDVVLLSPACASFDLFKNYEDRGEKFKQEVITLRSKISAN
jgi:UDP-N-acetylmuramoylalanine--D-glutamate ligase